MTASFNWQACLAKPPLKCPFAIHVSSSTRSETLLTWLGRGMIHVTLCHLAITCGGKVCQPNPCIHSLVVLDQGNHLIRVCYDLKNCPDHCTFLPSFVTQLQCTPGCPWCLIPMIIDHKPIPSAPASFLRDWPASICITAIGQCRMSPPHPHPEHACPLTRPICKEGRRNPATDHGLDAWEPLRRARNEIT